MPRSLSVSTTPITQPDRTNTQKSQKKIQQAADYDPSAINTEMDYIHERLNKIVVEDPALIALTSAAILTDVITRVNSLMATMQKAGLLKT